MGRAMVYSAIGALVLDVDGVLTDGKLAYGGMDESGPGANERVKVFHVQDGVAIKHWQQAGRQVAVLSGRQSPLVEQRARELGIETVFQGVTDKVRVFERICTSFVLEPIYVAFMGDDLPDVPVMRRCGAAIAPANAVAAAKRVAHFITRRRGGDGAAAEAIEWLLRKQGRWVGWSIPPAQPGATAVTV